MKRIIKTFYNFINESEAVPTGAEVVTTLSTIWDNVSSIDGSMQKHTVYVYDTATKKDVTLTFTKTNTHITLGGDSGKNVEKWLLANGAKQVPYKKKDGTYGYLNNVVDYAGLNMAAVKTMLTGVSQAYYYGRKFEEGPNGNTNAQTNRM